MHVCKDTAWHIGSVFSLTATWCSVVVGTHLTHISMHLEMNSAILELLDCQWKTNNNLFSPRENE